MYTHKFIIFLGAYHIHEWNWINTLGTVKQLNFNSLVFNLSN